jgi:hypothetical protein
MLTGFFLLIIAFSLVAGFVSPYYVSRLLSERIETYTFLLDGDEATAVPTFDMNNIDICPERYSDTDSHLLSEFQSQAKQLRISRKSTKVWVQPQELVEGIVQGIEKTRDAEILKSFNWREKSGL